MTATITLASVAMAASAATRFRRSGTTLDPLQPDHASVLVTSGANTITRNPMYVGLSGLLLAHAAWRGSWAALLPVAGFVAFIDRTQIPVEEAALHEKFGAAYEAYQANSPRWIDQRSLNGLQRLVDQQRS
ncbi:isoprenylcysteine carboxylmethyltransferase family protein [Pedococcus sp. KACC 23699]|uniref:Isoprenylcysteine carboxylmethyltransferase family protein n=1 Tax=Pedococcus sp. KACC 23699 TaxID=3149228 RepID=A0AAU7JYR5_9MICO